MSARLRAVFASAVAAALASVAVSSSGCGGVAVVDAADGGAQGDATVTLADGAVVPAPGDAGVDFTGAACGRLPVFQALTASMVAQPFDYLELRRSELENGPTGPTPGKTTTLATVGSPCQTATDKAACMDQIAKALDVRDLFPEIAGKQIPSSTYIVHQAGDTVRTISTREELLAFFGPIQAPEEARMLLEVDGYEPLCTAGSITKTAQGFTVIARRQTECLNQYEGFVLDVSTAGIVTVLQKVDLRDPSKGCAVAGRRPEGYQAPAASGESDLLAYLATMRSLEAASVPAFLRLADELSAHAAPDALRARAEEAAHDEVRHAAGFAWLRGLYGAKVTANDTLEVPRHVRTLEELAIENAVEGCVRETFGALVAQYQSETAADGPVRRLFATVAEDETRHAELAWDIAAWLDTKLDGPARDRVRLARDAALTELVTGLSLAAPGEELARRCGLPTLAASRVLVAECRALFAA